MPLPISLPTFVKIYRIWHSMAKQLFSIAVLCLLFNIQSPAKIWINEFMQSNIDLVRDDLQEFPDSWIELYNDSDYDTDIKNWRISDNSNYLSGWRITDSVVIKSKSYLLIYADKAATGLHADFRLESATGCVIYLFNQNGQQIDAVTGIPRQPAPNISRGRVGDGKSTWAYFVSATPGSSNTGKTSSTLLPYPIFSQAGGVFNDTVKVALSLPAGTPKGVGLSDIRYTLDNSEPTTDSPSYTEELEISETTVVRAKLIHPDYLSNISRVHSYIFSEQEHTLPIISISIDPEYLWDEEFGIYCDGNGKYGKIGGEVDFPVNWNNDWRRPVNFEYFPLESNSSVLNQLCEMRIAGGWSRSKPQKSFIVYGHKRFGISRFEYDLFKDKPKQEIKSFMIRNSGNDFWNTHFRDAAIQLFMGGKVNLDYQAYQPAIFYLNGKYWGIQNLRERSDEDFILANYATEDVDVVADWWGDLKAGDLVNWEKLVTELGKSHDMIDYKWLTEQIDIDEYINYMILQIYISNTDFPKGNMVMWRPRKTDGKWRFIVKDTDFGLGIWGRNLVTHNALEYNTINNSEEHRLFNALLTQDSFRKEFYSHFALYMGDLLHYNSTSQVIDSIYTMLQPAMPEHIIRWQSEIGWGDINTWHKEVSDMKKWCEDRNEEVYKHLKDFFDLGEIMKLTFEPDEESKTPAAYINGIRIEDSGLDASYFQGEEINLYYEGNSTLYEWEITKTVDEETTVEVHNSRELTYNIQEGCTSLIVKLKPYVNSLVQAEQQKINLSIINNQIKISCLQHLSVISIYDITGNLVAKITTTDRSIILPLNRKGVFIVQVQNDSQNLTEKVILSP